jgi:hypothetical protein
MLFRLAPAHFLLVCALGLGQAGCGEAADQTFGRAQYPAYDVAMRTFYPNEIDPAALGLGAVRSPRPDRAMWGRAVTADLDGRARIGTVTAETRLGEVVYRIGLEFANPPLAPPKVNEARWEITVTSGDPAYGFVRAFDSGLRGKIFVAFVKRFAGKDDEPDVHFYLAPDSADVAKVVQEAVALQEMTPR